ncbi:cyd operon YbgE family protein [Zoogloea sp.]|uniref:cyd operon YbgE family protein n=1 Tax=Zoogloea sp. TaxID=49181 RepID=UPI00321FC132
MEFRELADAPGRMHPAGMHLPSLAAALLIMLAGTLYPPLFAHGSGGADHGLALALFMAMSAGFVRGVGFIPAAPLWRWLFSGWTCLLALLISATLKFLH